MSSNFSKVGAVVDTVVSAVPKGNSFEYSGINYQPITLTLKDTGKVVWNKSEKANLTLSEGSVISFDISDGKTKDGETKITKVALSNGGSQGSGGGNSYGNGYNSEERLALEREKQIYISRSVALEKAIMYCDLTKHKPMGPDGIIIIADEFEQYLLNGKTTKTNDNSEA